MKVVVFGASGPTGKLVVQQGLAAGLQIRAVARNPKSLGIQHPNLEVVQGDVYDTRSVERAIEGQDAVISTYGVPYSFKPINVYSVGIENIITGMKKADVKRLVCVTSGGTHPGYDKNAGFFFSILMVNTIGRTLYADMSRMEELVKKSGLDWTIVRPARLLDESEVSDYRTGVGYSLPKGGITRRANLANFLVKEVQSGQYLREGVAVATDRAA